MPDAAELWQLLSLLTESCCCAAGHQTSKIKKELLAYLTQEWDHKVRKLLFPPLLCTLIKLLPEAIGSWTGNTVPVRLLFKQWP